MTDQFENVKEKKVFAKSGGLLNRLKEALAKVDAASLVEFDKHNIKFYDGMRKAVGMIKEEIKEL